MSVVANEIDYQKVAFSYPNYTLSKIQPIEGSQSRLITSGGDVLTFEIPPNQAFNLSKSYLNLRIAPQAKNSAFGWVPIDCISAIRELVIQTKGGLQLCYIPNFDVYTKMVTKVETKLDDFLCLDECSATGTTEGSSNGLSRSDDLVSNLRGKRYDNTASTINYTENQYLAVGLAGTDNVALTQGPLISWRIPLNQIFNSICSIDKDLLFNETLQFRITMNPANRYGFVSASGTDTTSTTATLDAYQLTNPFLYLAMEKNESVNSALRMKVMSPEGLTLLFDYIYGNKQAFSASTQQQIQLRFNRSNGLRLKKIYYALTPQAETLNNSFNISNINGAKIASFYTMLNNVRRLDYNVSCLTADGEDFMAMKDKLRGSTIQSSNHYQYNWTWVENFDDAISPLQEPKQPVDIVNLEQGLDLNIEQKYDFVATTANAGFNHYAYSACQKILIVNQNGVQII